MLFQTTDYLLSCNNDVRFAVRAEEGGRGLPGQNENVSSDQSVAFYANELVLRSMC